METTPPSPRTGTPDTGTYRLPETRGKPQHTPDDRWPHQNFQEITISWFVRDMHPDFTAEWRAKSDLVTKIWKDGGALSNDKYVRVAYGLVARHKGHTERATKDIQGWLNDAAENPPRGPLATPQYLPFIRKHLGIQDPHTAPTTTTNIPATIATQKVEEPPNTHGTEDEKMEPEDFNIPTRKHPRFGGQRDLGVHRMKHNCVSKGLRKTIPYNSVPTGAVRFVGTPEDGLMANESDLNIWMWIKANSPKGVERERTFIRRIRDWFIYDKDWYMTAIGNLELGETSITMDDWEDLRCDEMSWNTPPGNPAFMENVAIHLAKAGLKGGFINKVRDFFDRWDSEPIDWKNEEQ